MDDRRVQWLVNEDISRRRMECSFPAHLKGDISCEFGHPTQEHLPVAETLYDV